MSAINITAELSEKVEKTVNDVAFGDEIRWDVTMVAQPDSQGGMDVGYIVLLTLQGALLGSRMVRMIYLPMTHLEDAQGIHNGIRDAVEQMRAERTSELQSPSLQGGAESALIRGAV